MLMLVSKRRLLLLALIAATLVGCGKKGPPRPNPDDTQVTASAVVVEVVADLAGVLN